MKRSLVCVLSILALALAAPIVAQTEQTTSGTVVSSSATQLVIQTADGKQMTFAVDSNTTAPGTLQQGSTVTVRYHDMNGTFHAANVSAGTGSTATTPAATDTRTPALPETPATTSTTRTPARDQDTGASGLPATASPLPLMGLSGLLALAGGLGARALRRRK